ncbi:hypothetical protein [uncultured Fibrobacter sp.]|uniref:hypothetical protein n=1 Tax=uncultured Fibrobacter sp. TaxID=261512 RepID=UPI0025E93A11|nr:hypothetical protein [uncultured Fibrobacter sp.]
MDYHIPELISRESLSLQVAARLQELQVLRNEKQKALRNAPKGRLRISTSKSGHSHFYLVSNSNLNGVYVPEKELRKVQAVAQRDYDKAILSATIREIELLEKFAQRYKGTEIEDTYNSLNSARKRLVSPAILPDAKYAELWQSLPYKAKSFTEGSPEIYTSRGVRVRSKSEVIIADSLDSEGIPFRYEFPLTVKSMGTLHPDFYCLNIHSRKELVWEHFGLMDYPEYASNAVKKIELFDKSGYTLGDKFITTFETSTTPLNAKHVRSVIRKFLK